MRVFWIIIGLIGFFLVVAFLINSILPGFMSGMIEGGSMQVKVPYVEGTTVSTIQAGDAVTITAPITASLTEIFWVAVAVAVLGVAARIYHRRFMKPVKPLKSK